MTANGGLVVGLDCQEKRIVRWVRFADALRALLFAGAEAPNLKKISCVTDNSRRRRDYFAGFPRCVRICLAVFHDKKFLDCRSMGLRALCNDSPRTPPGPEGSNGNGSVSCAAEHPKFLLSPLWMSFILQRKTGLPHT